MKFFAALASTVAVALVTSAHAYSTQDSDPIATDLAPLLSPNARIYVRGDNSTLFDEVTLRYALVKPDISVAISVGAAEDVPVIVKYAYTHSREILAANRRHGWSKSLDYVKDAIMIDISTLTNITVDAAANTVTVGGGVRVGDVMPVLQAVGKETSTGICDCAGFLGVTLGGGHGRLQGRHGLVVDNILSAHLTIATGETITVSNTSNPDLFWALRGAGHNFGIVTEATYRIYDAVNGGVQYTTNAMYDPVYIPEIFKAMNDFDVPAESNALLAFFVNPVLGTPQMVMNFVSSAPEADARDQFKSAFGHIPYLSRNETMVLWASVNGQGLDGTGDYACRSRARKRIGGVSTVRYDIQSVLDAYEKYKEFTAKPGAEGSIMLFESYSVKAVQAVERASTAYPWRDETGVILLDAVYTDASLDDAANHWLAETMAILHADSGFPRPAVYMNYASGLEGFGAAYGYEKWRQRKLKDLKREWDPRCVFSGYNPIPIDCER
ncbi:FAD-binding domain-containing protein [Morchella conica CCBAS932]|uniref:FAD-binding domain-containing protein n=1 Tax=Morchella conica CCBAS932 TaxID=1392247 RepID=A0A3N4KXB4_9PEZI|nr:FAD-binding domain-containing protein [Morchella conica CCBAS932]